MLSRIAESLFWIGRYVERADDTARLLQTHLRLLVEDSSGPGGRRLPQPAGLMSVDDIEDPTRPTCSGCSATTPPSRPRSLRRWAAARDNARRAREVIPLDLWECINTTWHQLPPGACGTARHTAS